MSDERVTREGGEVSDKRMARAVLAALARSIKS